MDQYESLKLEKQLCFPLYAASRTVIKRYRPWLDALNLTYTQYIVMLVLWEERKISVHELGVRLYLDSGTLTPLLKSMEVKGFLRRYRSSKDERLLIAELTEQGEELREYAKDLPSKLGACIALSPQEAKELYRLLYKLLDMVPAESS